MTGEAGRLRLVSDLDDREMLEAVERDPEVQAERQRLAEAATEINPIMVVLRDRVRDLLVNETQGDFVRDETLPIMHQTMRRLHLALDHARGNENIRFAAERVAVELKIEDRAIIDKIVRTAQAIYKAMLREIVRRQEVLTASAERKEQATHAVGGGEMYDLAA